MSETVPVRFDLLYDYALAHRLNFNELCRIVRDSIGANPLEPLRELAGEGATVLVSSWVFQGDLTGWRVTARGMDGWRKTGDGKTLESAILAAQADEWRGAAVQSGESVRLVIEGDWGSEE